jgi:carbamoyl-phosphate synthase large subunit
MKSTGEVMGSAPTFEEAYAKSQLAAFNELPVDGQVFFRSPSTRESRELVRQLASLGFHLVFLEGSDPVDESVEVVDLETLVGRMKSKKISLAVNVGNDSLSKAARSFAVLSRVSQITTLAGVKAAIGSVQFLKSRRSYSISSLQELI